MRVAPSLARALSVVSRPRGDAPAVPALARAPDRLEPARPPPAGRSAPGAPPPAPSAEGLTALFQEALWDGGAQRARTAVTGFLDAADPAVRQRYLGALDEVRARRPEAFAALADFVEASTRDEDPVDYLEELSRLVARPGLSVDALRELGRKARSGQLEPFWLVESTLPDPLVDYLAGDKKTPWRALRLAMENAADPHRQRWAHSWLRGPAGEFLAEKTLVERWPQARICGRQERMRRTEADFVVENAGYPRRGMEVKSWAGDRWRRALDAYQAFVDERELSPTEVQYAGELDHLLRQLYDMQVATGAPSILAAADTLSKPVRQKLEQMLAFQVPGTEIIWTDDRELRACADEIWKGLWGE